MLNKKHVRLWLASLCLFAGVAVAGDEFKFNQGLEAFERHDYAEAMEIWRPLAESGDALAQHNLAIIYLFGGPEYGNFKQAVHWLNLAALQGLNESQTSLGTLYAQGLGVKQDYYKAFEWYYRAAEGGAPEAQYNLALMYSEGVAVSQDYAKAMKWLKRAAHQGYEPAREEMHKLLKAGLGLKHVPYAKTSRWTEFG